MRHPGVSAERPVVAVIGAGPCGVAAAIQLKRSGLDPVLFERRAVGGLLLNANLVENYPGFPQGIRGEAFCRLLERHLAEARILPRFEEVKEFEPLPEGGFRVVAARGPDLLAAVVIHATGTVPRRGILREEKSLEGEKVFFEVKDVPNPAPGVLVAILGAGDAAYDYALNLASRGCTVVLLERGPSRALPLLRERVAARRSIERMEGAEVASVRRSGSKIEVRMRSGRSSEKRTLVADFLLVACGRDPAPGLCVRRADGRLAGAAGRLPPGVFAGGDLVRGPFRQAAIAAGDGLTAAMEAALFLRGMEKRPRALDAASATVLPDEGLLARGDEAC